MTAILNLRGNKKMFTKAQITRQAKQREEIKVKILKAFGEDFIKQKQKELCAICRLRRAGGGCSEGLYPIDSHGNVCCYFSVTSNRH
ncbi:hypothetical protein DA01_08800 [Dehalococcoides mccartyi]|uniref:Uncharacterized protein n=1 Tax=Dehalococcoides mccartyi TaxID=61435 RepID=A0A0V8LXK0_9CHLR|nr:hypothetical protein [Dehalococcoides mccartyi]KSV16176.1 hypothetical protein DA01_08800 [Dehalococcoides mccartyi]